MLGFLNRWKLEREARKRIGIELHRQIKEAFELDETGTSARLQTSFCVGYIYYFVRLGFSTITGVIGERAADKHLRHICDGVLPKKLYEIFSRQLAALEIARQMEDQNKKIMGSNISPAETIKLFETGGEAGAADGSCFMPLGPIYEHKLRGVSLPSTTSKPDNLRRYLTGQDLNYKSLQREA
jgi:hypothetical protein